MGQALSLAAPAARGFVVAGVQVVGLVAIVAAAGPAPARIVDRERSRASPCRGRR
ncbi:hypothetical protein OJF2_78030 [Aquisphaera giovannonii]|uniref:Uncharacterized protein n=1 Tax=Aquisphaera giovannonii TaxID=406548 RepID=A0A5B9WGQ9_9BACT|nr:hypothetical protein [Aquisphaera giovannonii]QEH39191.1 hypothetical protein OJF2_78030 [Aquisphaera giovannonii]